MADRGQIVGYRRVSTSTQSLARQELPEVTGRIFEEKLTGAKRDRPALQEMLNYVRDGDEVHVHSIDRLARNLKDLEDIVSEIIGKGASIRFIKEGLHFKPDQETDPFQKLMFQMLGSFAEFERAIIKTRQAEGIKKAKAEGKFEGRKPSINYELVHELLRNDVSADRIAEWTGIGRASVFRIKKMPKTTDHDGDSGHNAEFLAFNMFMPIAERIDLIEHEKASGNPVVTNLEGILLHKLSSLKQTYNDAQQLLYAHSSEVKTKEAIKWLSNSKSAEEIAELKGIDIDYVEFAIKTAEGDGLYKI